MLNLPLSALVTANNINLVNKGAVAEIFAVLEILKYSDPVEPLQLYYWHHEQRNSSAEIDYVIQQQNDILPVEVKAGIIGKMKSLFLFLEEKRSVKGIRISLENFSSYKIIDTYPLYAISSL